MVRNVIFLSANRLTPLHLQAVRQLTVWRISCTLSRDVGNILWFIHAPRIMALRFESVFREYCWNCFIRRRQLITRPAAVAAEAFFYAWNSRGGIAAAVSRACGEKTRPAHAHQHVRALMHVSPTPLIFQPLSGSLPSASRQ